MRRPRPAFAVVAAAVVLTLGVGGGSFAAGKITGADIKDGTVTSADIKNDTLTSRDLKNGSVGLQDLAPFTLDELSKGPRVLYSSKGPGSYIPDSGDETVFSTLTLPDGIWLVSLTATAFPHSGEIAAEPFAQCFLQTPDQTSAESVVAFPASTPYVSLNSQMVVNAAGETVVSLACSGDNFGINQVTMTAVEAGSVTQINP